jgi:hypothetical protein
MAMSVSSDWLLDRMSIIGLRIRAGPQIMTPQRQADGDTLHLIGPVA